MDNGATHVFEGSSSADLVPVPREDESCSIELDATLEQCIHFAGGPDDEPLRLRRLKSRSPEGYQQLASQLESLVHQYMGPIRETKFNSSKKYLSQVLRFTDGQHRKRILRRLAEELPRYPGSLFITTDEINHMHFVHDCPCSNGSCRCRVFKDEDFRGLFRNNLRGTRYITELDTIDWYNILSYFVYSKWQFQSQVWIGGRLRRTPSADQIIRWKDLQRIASESNLESQEEGDGLFGPVQSSSGQEHQGIHGACGASSSQKRSQVGGTSAAKRQRSEPGVPKQSKFQRILSKTESLLNEAVVIPPIHVKELFTGPLALELHNPSNFKYYEAACHLWGTKFNRWSLKEIAEFYEGKEPVFYANDINPYVYYHDRQTSFNFVHALINHQYGEDEELIKEFLVNLQDWFNKFGWNKNPKCNALCVVGPPNSGKNYFFDMLAALACNVGHIGRVNNKTNNFALQDCVNRRLVVGNEISMEDGAKEDFKKLCEGTALNIRVKFQGDKIFTKTPVLLISNYTLDICTHIHFKDVRLKTIDWGMAELLKDSLLKPYPLCLFDLYKHYNIELE